MQRILKKDSGLYLIRRCAIIWSNIGDFMEWTQFVIFFVGVFGLFIWNRTESRSDSRQTDAKLEAIRSLMYAMIQESKDFHGRLCAIEERNKK